MADQGGKAFGGQQPNTEKEATPSATPNQPSQTKTQAVEKASNTSESEASLPRQSASRNVPSTATANQQSQSQQTSAATPSPPSPPSPQSPPVPIVSPITKETLADLDIEKTTNDLAVRHELHFDPHLSLQFVQLYSPDRDCEMKAFFDALERQLTEFANPQTQTGFLAKYAQGKEEWYLPVYLRTVREILLTYVSVADRKVCGESLNVDHFMQQFYRGVADLDELASWLAGVIKQHCAPMRDSWVDHMHKQISQGNREGDITKVVNGMRSLLELLEAMKIDVRNHQMLSMRLVLVQQGVGFEQHYFHMQLMNDPSTRQRHRQWYLDTEASMSQQQPTPADQSNFGSMFVFCQFVVRMMLPNSCMSSLPSTFQLDMYRIGKLRSQVLDIMYVAICTYLYTEYDHMLRFGMHDDSEHDCLASGAHNTGVPLESDAMIEYYDDEDDAASDEVQDDQNVPLSAPSIRLALPRAMSHSLETASTTLDAAGSSSDSGFGPGPQAQQRVLTPMSAVHRSKVRALRQALHTIADSIPYMGEESNRSEQVAAALAVEVGRALSNHDSVLVRGVEAEIYKRLTRRANSMTEHVQDHKSVRSFGRYFAPAFGRHMKAMRGLSNEQLYTYAHTHVQQLAFSPPRDGVERRGHDTHMRINAIAVRVAHMAILHWRIWAPIAYLCPEGVDPMAPGILGVS